MKEDLRREISLEENITAFLEENMLVVKGSQGEVRKNFIHPKIKIDIENKKIIVRVKAATKREKRIIGSFESHIINMVQGVQEPHQYKLKICSGHFPINVSVSGQEVMIKNFLGESVPRRVVLLPGAKIKVEGNIITITSPDKEIAGMNANKIESACRITNRDRRIFQDGCYIIHKAGKDIV